MAGVSITTASHVLNGYTRSGIKEETSERVRRIARDLGYRPNAIARSLKVQRTNTVGFYTGYGFRDARDPFMGEIYTGIQHGCDEFKLDFLIHGDINGRDPDEIRMKLSDGKVDGLIVHAPIGDPVIAHLASATLPTVAIADPHPALPSIVADDIAGMALLVDYLWSKGHRHVVYLTSEIKITSINLRANAFRVLMDERGGRWGVEPFPWTDPHGYLEGLKHRSERPTAVCCWNDSSAYFLLRACLEIGTRIPDELAVVGFDGLLEMRLPARKLVTVQVPWEKMAHEAVRRLVDQSNGIPVPQLVKFPVSVLDGDTA
jgi:LacI family transcriptional regulator